MPDNMEPADRPVRTAQTRDPEGTRGAILAASVEEFSEKGFEGARIDAIARRASINKRMLYHYFGGKDVLYRAVLEQIYGDIRRSEAALDLAHLAPRAGLRELVLFTWRYFQDHPEFLSLLASENMQEARYLKSSGDMAALNSNIIDTLRDIVERGEASGEFRRGIDALDLYLSIAALAFFYLSNRWTLTTVFGRDLSLDASRVHWGDHMVEVVDRYTAASPSA